MVTTTPNETRSRSASGTTAQDSDRSNRKRQRHNERQARDGNGSGYGQGAVIGAAAAGLLAGLAATIGRKAAIQAASTFTGDWLDVLKAEHQAARRLFDKLEATDNSQTTKRAMLLAQLKHALAKHAFEEENLIYPTLRDHGDTEQADHLNHEHGYVKQFLFDLGHMPRNSSAWLDKLRKFRTQIEQHMREEEDVIFPKLHERIGKATNGELSGALAREGYKLA